MLVYVIHLLFFHVIDPIAMYRRVMMMIISLQAFDPSGRRSPDAETHYQFLVMVTSILSLAFYIVC